VHGFIKWCSGEFHLLNKPPDLEHITPSIFQLTSARVIAKSRYGRFYLWITHGLMTPFLLVFSLVPGKWVYAATILAGGFNMASLPLGVVMAQKIAPKGRSMVASLMMGLAFGTGGIFSPIVGKLGDIFTIQSVLMLLVCIPVLSLIPIYFIPEVGKHNDGQS
jgi:fucose permease